MTLFEDDYARIHPPADEVPEQLRDDLERIEPGYVDTETTEQ